MSESGNGDAVTSLLLAAGIKFAFGAGYRGGQGSSGRGWGHFRGKVSTSQHGGQGKMHSEKHAC